MKLAIIHVFVLGAVVLGICTPADAELYEMEYGVGHRDDYIVVERSGTTLIEEPAPRVVVVHAPPPPPRRVVVRPERPCVGAIWVEGYWRYTGVRFVWVRAHWIAPRDGYRFVPPRWHVHAGYHYHTPGYFRPYHAKVRRPAYHHYRPRPGYVYYRGYQRPNYRSHHPPGHYKQGVPQARHAGVARPQSRPSAPRVRVGVSRNSRPSKARQVAAVQRR
ncbi:MAG: hypothetical protein HKN10_06740 [Myxococcales bacterium]|nr:hypothetical protein [Myxococcales bacterium]